VMAGMGGGAWGLRGPLRPPEGLKHGLEQKGSANFKIPKGVPLSK
jgi:hypothetical protein